MKTEIINITDYMFLYPSAILVPDKQINIHTILGSCVSVCLFDTLNKVGGMNHFMLPLWNGQGLESPKYGNIAIEKLYDKLMLKTGGNGKHLIAKVFGGGEVIKNSTPNFKIGERNIEIAFQILKKLQIPITAKSVGGENGRKIIFDTGTGNVSQRYVNASNNF